MAILKYMTDNFDLIIALLVIILNIMQNFVITKYAKIVALDNELIALQNELIMRLQAEGK